MNFGSDEFKAQQKYYMSMCDKQPILKQIAKAKYDLEVLEIVYSVMKASPIPDKFYMLKTELEIELAKNCLEEWKDRLNNLEQKNASPTP